MVSRRQRTLAMKTGGTDGSDFGIDPARYAAWIAYVFDRPESDRGWFFKFDHPQFDLTMTPSEFVGLFGLTMLRCGTDLARFSNAQISDGLKYLFSSACSDDVYAFGEDHVPESQKSAALLAMKHLYKDCFAPRCDPRLGHCDESISNPLNYNAYMLWDDTPIFRFNRHREKVVAAIVEVWEFALGSSNVACIEGALHGLGHERRSSSLIDPIFERFLATTCDSDDHRGNGGRLRPIRKELRDYAQRARFGGIQ